MTLQNFFALLQGCFDTDCENGLSVDADLDGLSLAQANVVVFQCEKHRSAIFRHLQEGYALQLHEALFRMLQNSAASSD